ncbi:hypothetical protein DFH08DRAFT_723424, partial [Mycena albidolilacea]
LSRTAAERSKPRRRAYKHEIDHYPPEYLVFADEAAVNILTTYRMNGWSLKGFHVRKSCKFVRGPRCVHLRISS